jgi:hypothetical protein
MNTCIYYPQQTGLTFTNSEHVIPAGIGGRQTLPKGYVSDQFNNDISGAELRFMRESILAMPRQMVGPGKRGRTTPQHATRSAIQLIGISSEPGQFSLGYLQLAKAIHLAQIRLNIQTGLVNWSVDASQPQPDDFFITQLRKLNEANTRYINAAELPEHEILIGFDEDTYIARPANSNFTLTPEITAGLIASIASHTEPANVQHQPVSIRQPAHFDDDFYRVCAKIAMNTLALLKGQEFVLDTRFDAIRNYIARGGINTAVTYIPIPRLMPRFPPDAHQVIIAATQKKLAAVVCFYNYFALSVILAEDFTTPFIPDGLICDWQNKREYLLSEC